MAHNEAHANIMKQLEDLSSLSRSRAGLTNEKIPGNVVTRLNSAEQNLTQIIEKLNKFKIQDLEQATVANMLRIDDLKQVCKNLFFLAAQ